MKTPLTTTLLVASSLTLGSLAGPAQPAGARGATLQQTGTTPMPAQQKIVTSLWFKDKAEEAMRHYTSIFKDAKLLSESRWGEGGPMPKGTLMAANFQLAGQEFMVLNSAPEDNFTEAISLLVNCDTQAEVDELWNKLTAGGGQPGQCGWLKDKYGVSWQIVPTVLPKLLGDKDPAKARRVAEAMMQMTKLDIQRLQAAYDQK